MADIIPAVAVPNTSPFGLLPNMTNPWFGPILVGTVWWYGALNTSGNKFALYRSVDDGSTWGEVDAAHAPANGTAYSVCFYNNKWFCLARSGATSTFNLYSFDLAAVTPDSSRWSSISSTTISIPAGGSLRNIIIQATSAGNIYFIYKMTSVANSDYYRVTAQVWNGSSWTAAVDTGTDSAGVSTSSDGLASACMNLTTNDCYIFYGKVSVTQGFVFFIFNGTSFSTSVVAISPHQGGSISSRLSSIYDPVNDRICLVWNARNAANRPVRIAYGTPTSALVWTTEDIDNQVGFIGQWVRFVIDPTGAYTDGIRVTYALNFISGYPTELWLGLKVGSGSWTLTKIWDTVANPPTTSNFLGIEGINSATVYNSGSTIVWQLDFDTTSTICAGGMFLRKGGTTPVVRFWKVKEV